MAGNSVGSLYVDVEIKSNKATVDFVKAMKKTGEAGEEALSSGLSDVDTNKLEAEIRLLKAKIENILQQTGFELDPDFKKAEAAIRLFRAEEEAEELGLELTAHDEKLRVMIDAARERAEADEIELVLTAEIDRSEWEKEKRKLQRLLAQINTSVPIEPDLDDLSLEQIKRRIEAINAEVSVELSDADLDKELARTNQRIKNRLEAEAQLKIDDAKAAKEAARATKEVEAYWKANSPEALLKAKIDDGLLQAEKAKLRKEIKEADTRVNIGVRFDLDQLSKKQLQAYRRLQESKPIKVPVKATGKNGKKFGKNDLGSLPSDMTKVFIALGLVAGDALGAGIAGGVSAATAVVSSAASALAGAVGPAIPIIGGLGAVLGASIVGTQGFGSALGAVNEELSDAKENGRAFNENAEGIRDALKELHPEAQEVVKAFAGMREQMGELRLDIQGKLFDGVADSVSSLNDSIDGTPSTLEDVSQSLGLAAVTARRFGEGLIWIANQTDFTSMWIAIQPAIDAVLRTGLELIDTFEPFLMAAAPAAQKLAEYLWLSAAGLKEWVYLNPDTIAKTLEDGVISLKAWASLLGNVGGLLADVFKVGKEEGDNFVRSLDGLITRWREFLTANDSQALKDFFEFGRQAIVDFQPVIKGLGDAILKLTTDQAADNFRSLSEAVGDALPVLADMLVAFGSLQILQTSLVFLTVAAEGFVWLMEVIEPIAPAIGAFIIAFTGLAKVTLAVKALGVAIAGLGASSGILLAVSAAAAAAYVIFTYQDNATKQLEARSAELVPALRNVTNELILTATSSNAATVGLEGLNEAITDTGEDGEKLTRSLVKVGKSADDALTILLDMGKDSVGTLQELAEGMGLPEEAALKLAKAVDATDDNFSDSDILAYELAQTFKKLSESTGLSEETLVGYARTLEEIQDQQEKTDVQGLARDFIELEGGASGAKLALLEQAEATTGVTRSAENLLPLYEEFTKLLAENKIEADEAAQVALDAAIAYDQVDKSLENVAGALGPTTDALGPMNEKLLGTATNLREGAEKASAFNERIAIVTGTAFQLGGSLDGAQRAINDVVDAFTDGSEPIISYGELMNGTTNLAIDQRNELRTVSKSIQNYGADLLESGASSDEAAAKVNSMTAAFAEQLKQVGFTDSEVANLLNTYGLAPADISTVFGAENLDEIQGLASAYVDDQDDIKKRIATEYVAPELPGNVQLIDEYKGTADNLDNRLVTTDIELPNGKTVNQLIEDYSEGLDNLPSMTTADVEAPNLEDTNIDVADLKEGLGDLPGLTTVKVEVPALAGLLTDMDELTTKINNLPNKQITITTVYKSIGNRPSGGGGGDYFYSLPGDSGGSGTRSTPATSKTNNITNQFTINQASDAHAVAAQVANRAAFALN